MAILNSSKTGTSYNTETGIRTNADKTTTPINVVDVNDLEKNVVIPEGKTTTKADSFFTSTPDYTTPDTTEATTPETASPDVANTDITKQIESRREILDMLGLGDITDTIKKLTEKGTKQAKAEEAAGIGEMSKTLSSTQSAIREKQLRYTREQEAIEKQTGLTAAQKQARLNQVKRDQARDLANDYIIEATQRDDLRAAQDAVDRQIDLEFEPLQDALDYQKYFFEENKDLYTTVEQREYEKKHAQDQAKLDREKDDYKTIQTLKVTMAQNGASPSILSKISNAKTVDEALAVGGRYLTSPKEKLELQKLQNDVDISAVELSNAKAYLGGSTGDAVSDIIAGSAKNGKKYMTDSQLEKVQQAQSALSSLGVLQSLLVTGEDGVDLSGPITGRKRILINQLGGDASTSAIKATIQGLIPTVARGIFGEVGVLTDADIENYKKTIPNLTSTEDQNKLVAVIMYDTLANRMANTLSTNAKNGKNVSEFLSDYSNAKKQIDSLKAELGVTTETPISPETETYLDNALGNNSGTNALDKFNSAITSYSSLFTRKSK